jgi:hypothetical protein
MKRRAFLKTLGGSGVIVAASAVGLARCDPMPTEAVAAWDGPAPAEADPRRRALSWALLAPNPHNLQSWAVDLSTDGEIALFVDADRLLPETGPYARQILVGHGCFLELLAIAAAEDGFRADVALFPEGEPPLEAIGGMPVARVRLIADPSVAKDRLFAEIPRRRSNKEPYDPERRPSADEIAALGAGHAGATSLAYIEDAERVAALKEICIRASMIEMETPRTHQESIELTRIGGEAIARHRDGIDLHGPMFWWLSTLGLFTAEKAATPGTMAWQGGVDYTQGWRDSAVVFGLLSTAGNTRADQVAAGRAYVRQNLEATRLGLAMTPLSQVLQEYPEMTDLQRRFLDLAGTPEDHTVPMLSRIGHAAPVGPSPRRDLGDLIVA